LIERGDDDAIHPIVLVDVAQAVHSYR
jgi:hypothetical protein